MTENSEDPAVTKSDRERVLEVVAEANELRPLRHLRLVGNVIRRVRKPRGSFET